MPDSSCGGTGPSAAWVVERPFARPARFRRLTSRHERRADLHHALTTLAWREGAVLRVACRAAPSR